MGHKKRNPIIRSKQSYSSSPVSPDVTNGVNSNEDNKLSSNISSINDSLIDKSKIDATEQLDASFYTSVKIEYERALTSFRGGNHTKALRLMKDLCLRHENSALVHRFQSNVCIMVASLVEDSNAKQRHLKNAMESAKKAVLLSPNSIKYYLLQELFFGVTELGFLNRF